MNKLVLDVCVFGLIESVSAKRENGKGDRTDCLKVATGSVSSDNQVSKGCYKLSFGCLKAELVYILRLNYVNYQVPRHSLQYKMLRIRQ